MKGFKKINVKELDDNVVKLISKDWFLITAGDISDFNTMTASWGMIGHIWNIDVAMCLIRPQRYTYEYAEKNSIFTLSVFNEEYRNALNFCGKNSGRDVNKMEATGLIPVATELNSTAFQQARLIIECEKIYFDDLKPGNFLLDSLLKNYPINDFHRYYIGAIRNCYIKE